VWLQFFMIKSLRYGILSSPDASANIPAPPALTDDAPVDPEAPNPEDALTEDVLYQLQVCVAPHSLDVCSPSVSLHHGVCECGRCQMLFGHLLLSERKYYNPMPWLHAYKDETGRPTNVLVQQDAQVRAVTVLCRRGSSKHRLAFYPHSTGCCIVHVSVAVLRSCIQEYFNMFCDRLEHRLRGSAQEKLLQVTLPVPILTEP
jgi:hypothetical protein